MKTKIHFIFKSTMKSCIRHSTRAAGKSFRFSFEGVMDQKRRGVNTFYKNNSGVMPILLTRITVA